MKRRLHTDFIVVHCAASQNIPTLGAKQIRQWHIDKGWSDIGYHYVIKTDGTIEDGRDLNSVGAHVQGHNSNSVGICLIGGVDKKGRSVNNFTEAQFKSLRKLINDLLKVYHGAVIMGHRDFPGVKKDCPCFDVNDWWAGVSKGS